MLQLELIDFWLFVIVRAWKRKQGTWSVALTNSRMTIQNQLHVWISKRNKYSITFHRFPISYFLFLKNIKKIKNYLKIILLCLKLIKNLHILKLFNLYIKINKLKNNLLILNLFSIFLYIFYLLFFLSIFFSYIYIYIYNSFKF